MAVGFLGTLVGFIFMLDLSGLTSGNAAQATLVTLTTGMKTALYTTVMALISSIVIKCTLYIIANDLEKIAEDNCTLTEK
jgi:biopolymer transport protein ExbB/TolQ